MDDGAQHRHPGRTRAVSRRGRAAKTRATRTRPQNFASVTLRRWPCWRAGRAVPVVTCALGVSIEEREMRRAVRGGGSPDNAVLSRRSDWVVVVRTVVMDAVIPPPTARPEDAIEGFRDARSARTRSASHPRRRRRTLPARCRQRRRPAFQHASAAISADDFEPPAQPWLLLHPSERKNRCPW
jgi:hypothetical protein